MCYWCVHQQSKPRFFSLPLCEFIVDEALAHKFKQNQEDRSRGCFVRAVHVHTDACVHKFVWYYEFDIIADEKWLHISQVLSNDSSIENCKLKRNRKAPTKEAHFRGQKSSAVSAAREVKAEGKREQRCHGATLSILLDSEISKLTPRFVHQVIISACRSAAVVVDWGREGSKQQEKSKANCLCKNHLKESLVVNMNQLFEGCLSQRWCHISTILLRERVLKRIPIPLLLLMMEFLKESNLTVRT